jgi:hypothetical protein
MNVFHLDYKFPKDVLLEEYNKICEDRTEVQEPDSRRFTGFWLIWNTPITKAIAKEFLETYGLTHFKHIVNFLYVEPNGILPWHSDQGGSISAINCIISPHPEPIEFAEGKYTYDTALVDVRALHQVINGPNPRILFRITFQDEAADFNTVKNLICQKS